jgi:signal peptidase
MAPVFWDADMVLIESITQEYEVGDIVVFKNPQSQFQVEFIHRIIAIKNNRIKTKGDNAPEPDGWSLSQEDIMGKAVTYNGRPIVIKDVGAFFMVNYYAGDFKKRDPVWIFITNFIEAIRTFAPMFLAIILILLLSTYL